MAANNQISVLIQDGYIIIQNLTNPNSRPEYYPQDKITSIQPIYQDLTTLRALQPGRYERDLIIKVVVDLEDIPTELVKIEFDIQDVTNQPTWTPDLAGLSQAIDDLRTVTSPSITVVPNQTNVDLATVVGDYTASIDNFYTTKPWSIQFVWDNLTGVLDGQINIYSSNDNVNFELVDNFTPIDVTTASGSSSVFKSDYSFKYIQIEFVKNGVTGGDFAYLIIR